MTTLSAPQPTNKPKTKLKKYLYVSFGTFGAVACFALGVAANATWPNLFSRQSLPQPVSIRQDDPSYPLTEPLLYCSEKTDFYEVKPLDKKLTSYVKAQEKAGNATDISIYYKDLSSGRWEGVNENDLYSPASLLKVAVMIAYIKTAENDPTTLTKEILYDPTTDQDNLEYYNSTSTLIKGQTYTLASLVQAMITHSDNNALDVLQQFLDPTVLTQVFTDLQLPATTTSTNIGDDFLSPKLYSHLFRVLYNATYLDRDFSEKALELLSETTFELGLRAGVPADVTVADKYGERTVTDPSSGNVQYRELHDCGIIYHKTNPYLLCVMTKGQDFSKLANIIKTVSQTVYQGVDSNFTN